MTTQNSSLANSGNFKVIHGNVDDFVLFAETEFLEDGHGFWNNEEGWVLLEDAQKYSKQDTYQPILNGQKFITFASAKEMELKKLAEIALQFAKEDGRGECPEGDELIESIKAATFEFDGRDLSDAQVDEVVKFILEQRAIDIHRDVKENRKYASGNWTHLFGVGSRETTCRIVIDLEKPELIAAQEWTGLKYEDVLGDRLKDLAESVLDANDAHENPEEYGLEVGAEVPDWASKYLVQEAHANALETLSSLKLDAMQLVKVQNAIDLALPSENGRDYECGFKDALQSMCLALAEKLDANALQAVINTALDAYGNNVDLDVDDSPSLGM